MVERRPTAGTTRFFLPDSLLLILAAVLATAACGGPAGVGDGVTGAPVAAPSQDEGSVVSLGKKAKVLICHKGKDKMVPESALGGHLGHGDTEGSCQPSVSCPCFSTENIDALPLSCPDPLNVLACSVPDPAILVLTCGTLGNEAGFVAGQYIAQNGSCTRTDVNSEGPISVGDLTAEEQAACAAAIGTCS